MGYTTEFRGEFALDKPLAPEHKAYLEAFSGTRRMLRDPAKCLRLDDPVREAAGLPVGDDGGYFVGSPANYGQNDDGTIIEYNTPPHGQPGLWCKWVPNDDGTAIEWDGCEKFYNYVEWLRYIISHFLEPWGYTANGEVEWRGEDWDDNGTLVVENNVVTER